MKIGAISELDELTVVNFNSLSSTSDKYYIEMSQNDSDSCSSKKYDLNQCMRDIGILIGNLYELLNNLSGEMKEISGNYLPLAGGTLTGRLQIGKNGQFITNPLTIYSNTTSQYNIKTIGSKAFDFSGDVTINNDGILQCKNDISGCALTAKWS